MVCAAKASAAAFGSAGSAFMMLTAGIDAADGRLYLLDKGRATDTPPAGSTDAAFTSGVAGGATDTAAGGGSGDGDGAFQAAACRDTY